MQMRCLLTLVFVTSSVCAQSLTETQTLHSLAQVWGFLKYYHPAVSTGRYDWDNQFIRLIPAVRQAHNREQLSALYLRVLDTLGPVSRCKKCISVGTMPISNRRNLDLSVLANSIQFSSELRQQLLYIKDNRNQKKNVYVQRIKSVENTGYEREKLYTDMRIPDEAYRLLALFRYWNIIQYFFPYKYAIDGDWNNALTDLIPVFRQATTESAYQQAIYQMVARIQDSHGFLITVDKTRCMRCELGRFWLPFAVKVINNRAIITRFYADSLPTETLRIGTVISQIDGIPIQTHLDRLRPYIAASTEANFLRDVNGLIGAGKTTQGELTIEQQGRDTTLYINRSPFQTFSKAVLTATNARYPVSTWLKDSIGYVNLGKLTSKQVDSTMKPLLNAKAIIFDLRNYPQGTYWLITRYLLNQPAATTFAQFTGPDFNFPGVFHPVGTAVLPAVARKQLYTGKVIVLINEDSQSHAEFTAMAFRLVPGVTFVGSPTAGADGNISWVPLPGGYRTAFSGLGVYYPDGRETQRVGIKPDVVIEPTVAGIREGRDDVLLKAIELCR